MAQGQPCRPDHRLGPNPFSQQPNHVCGMLSLASPARRPVSAFAAGGG
ncbi:hypothetical protein [Azospirillum doebereinerae]